METHKNTAPEVLEMISHDTTLQRPTKPYANWQTEHQNLLFNNQNPTTKMRNFK